MGKRRYLAVCTDSGPGYSASDISYQGNLSNGSRRKSNTSLWGSVYGLLDCFPHSTLLPHCEDRHRIGHLWREFAWYNSPVNLFAENQNDHDDLKGPKAIALRYFWISVSCCTVMPSAALWWREKQKVLNTLSHQSCQPLIILFCNVFCFHCGTYIVSHLLTFQVYNPSQLTQVN